MKRLGVRILIGYAELSKQKESTEEMKEVLREQKIKLYVAPANRERLVSLGVIEPKVRGGVVSAPLK